MDPSRFGGQHGPAVTRVQDRRDSWGADHHGTRPGGRLRNSAASSANRFKLCPNPTLGAPGIPHPPARYAYRRHQSPTRPGGRWGVSTGMGGYRSETHTTHPGGAAALLGIHLAGRCMKPLSRFTATGTVPTNVTRLDMRGPGAHYPQAVTVTTSQPQSRSGHEKSPPIREDDGEQFSGSRESSSAQ